MQHALGESLYVFSWADFLFVGLVIGAWIFMKWFDKAPTVSEIRDFINVWNSRGGNIVVLLALTVYSIRVAMRLIYHVIELAQDGKLDSTNAVIAVALAFVTGSLYGTFSGALIKTMTGNEGGTAIPPAAPPPVTNGNVPPSPGVDANA